MDSDVEQRQALADRIRQQHARGAGRGRVGIMVFVILVIVASVVALLWFQSGAADDGADLAEPRHATDEYGFKLTAEPASDDAEPADDVVDVAVYVDFLCDSCRIFHEETSDYLAQEVAAGSISLEYRPISFLTAASTDEYSQRAANAAVCVADAADVAAYGAMHDLLLEHQPEQGGPGLDDDRLMELADQAGAGDVADCIGDRTFTPWVDAALRASLAADVSETPTVRVSGATVVRSQDGQESMPGREELEYAIEANR